MTAMTGSAPFALSALRGSFTAEEAWAAHVDEDWINELGADAEAEARRVGWTCSGGADGRARQPTGGGCAIKLQN